MCWVSVLRAGRGVRIGSAEDLTRRAELTRLHGLRDDRVHTIGERLGVARRWPLQDRRWNRIVHDQQHIGWLGAQPVLWHRLARADDRDWHDRQPGLDGQQKTSALESCG